VTHSGSDARSKNRAAVNSQRKLSTLTRNGQTVWNQYVCTTQINVFEYRDCLIRINRLGFEANCLLRFLHFLSVYWCSFLLSVMKGDYSTHIGDGLRSDDDGVTYHVFLIAKSYIQTTHALSLKG
jgi:hypothetical protein